MASMPTPTRKKSSCLTVAFAGGITVVLLLVVVGLLLNARKPSCERVLLRWQRPARLGMTDAVAEEDRRHHPITVTEPSERVHVDADLAKGTGFLDFSWSSVYLVRVGTPDDLVQEAIHPYGSTGGSAGSSVGPGTTIHEAGWTAPAIASGAVVKVGTGKESVNENVTLTAGDWYVAGDNIYRASIFGCA